mgnify:CR=1 FL=1
MKIRRGDKVIIIAGKDRHRTGVVERVLTKHARAVVTGLNMVKKHLKRSSKNPQGGIIDKPMPINLSNLMLLDPSQDKPTRVGYRQAGSSKVRFTKLSSQEIVVKKQPR